MLGELIEYVSVFFASALNLNYGLGLSMTFGLSKFELFLLMSSGSVTGIIICLVLGAQLKMLWQKKIAGDSMSQSEPGQEGKGNLIARIWQRYGLWGLAVSTAFIGPVPPVAISLLSGLRKDLILLYLGIGKFFWSTVFAFLGHNYITKILESIF